MGNQGKPVNVQELKDAVENAATSLNIAAGNLKQLAPAAAASYAISTGPFGEPFITVTFAS